MSVSEAARGVADESVESMELAPDVNGFHLEPRCRICRNDQVRTKVNDLLATGASYAMVLRALGDDNAKLEKRDRVTIDSIPRQAYPAAGTSWVPTGSLRGAVCCLRGPGRLRGESAGGARASRKRLFHSRNRNVGTHHPR